MMHTQHTPSGLLALSFVQFGTLLLNGQSFCSRYRIADGESFQIGKPKISPSGCELLIDMSMIIKL
jgi:hypothetical protein